MNLIIKGVRKFEARHIGPSQEQIEKMLKEIGARSLGSLIDETLPETIRITGALDLPAPLNEPDFLVEFRKELQENKLFKSYIGLGYYNTHTPGIIQRNILENPGWYTAYTPYQAEISQGRLEALINFQTMVTDLTGMEIANASLLDEGTAAAEAMAMLFALRKKDKNNSRKFIVDLRVFPQTKEVLLTRAKPAGIDIEFKSLTSDDLDDDNVFGIMLQYPDSDGEIHDHRDLVEKASGKDIYTVFAADLLSLTLLTPPGAFGADVVVGTTQRFGIPLGYGGPHAAYFATRDVFKRQLPGRIIGVSVDSKGQKAYRMALQTREQHIRRERATSNICTAQVLLAIMAGMYGVYHGPDGLRSISLHIHHLATSLEEWLDALGYKQENEYYFDTLKVSLNKGEKETIRRLAESRQINFRYFDDDFTGISLDETTSQEDIMNIAAVFADARSLERPVINPLDGVMKPTGKTQQPNIRIPGNLKRESTFLEHPVFNSFHAEHF